MFYPHVHVSDCYVYTLTDIEVLNYELVRKEGEGERRAMLRMRIGLDFTILGTLLLMPTLVQHSGCAGYIRLVWADTILWCPALLYLPCYYVAGARIYCLFSLHYTTATLLTYLPIYFSVWY